MSYDTQAAINNNVFWTFFIENKSDALRDSGWVGPISKTQLETVKENWAVLEDVFEDTINCDAKEVDFDEDDGGGIPGSSDFVSIVKYGNLYFFNGSSMCGGPYPNINDAYVDAGLNG